MCVCVCGVRVYGADDVCVRRHGRQEETLVTWAASPICVEVPEALHLFQSLVPAALLFQLLVP